jgi:hypothetical protein
LSLSPVSFKACESDPQQDGSQQDAPPFPASWTERAALAYRFLTCPLRFSDIALPPYTKII